MTWNKPRRLCVGWALVLLGSAVCLFFDGYKIATNSAHVDPLLTILTAAIAVASSIGFGFNLASINE